MVLSSSEYISFPQTTDARDLMARAFAYLQAKIPGWVPAEGNLDTWIIEAFASEAADIQTLATEVPKTIFRTLGAKLFGINPIDSVSAIVTSTWTLSDSLGHTIPAGTVVSILDLNGNAVPFQVLSDVIVPGGSSATGAGAVQLMAVTPGSAPNGIGMGGGVINLVDTLSFVLSVAQVSAVAGGVDAESDDTYLTRLSVELQTLTFTPILPPDFSKLARNIAGIQRAITIDGYNPSDHSTGNARMVTVYGIDSTGAGVDSTHKTALAAYLNSLREANFIVNTDDPSPVRVSVTASINAVPGYSLTDVQNRVAAAITAFLSPATWGIDQSDDPNAPVTWSNVTSINYLQLGSIISDVAGVALITSLTIGLHSGAQFSADLALSGEVPIPFVGAGDVVVGTGGVLSAVKSILPANIHATSTVSGTVSGAGANLYQPWWIRTSFWNTPIGGSPVIDPSSASMLSHLYSLAENLVFNGGSSVGGGGSTTLFHANAATPHISITLDFPDVNGHNPVSLPIDPAWGPTTDSDHHMAVICDVDITAGGFTYVKGTVFEFQALDMVARTAHAVAYENVLTSTGAAPSPDGISVLPIVGGLITPLDISSGVIAHAIRLGVNFAASTFRKPSRHSDGGTSGGPPGGALIQMLAATSLAGLDAYQTMVCVALKTYGGYIGDSSGAFNTYVQSTSDGSVYPTDWSDSIPFATYNGNLRVIDPSSVPGLTY